MFFSNFILTIFFIKWTSGFLIGGCIGPKKAFEKFLTETEKRDLTAFIENRFDGRNKDKVLHEILVFLKKRLTVAQWETIEPEIVDYQKKNISCSPYSQLLPPKYFKPLMKAVRRAVETGADRSKIKYLVEDYLDRILFTKEFVKEFRKQPPIEESKIKPIKILKPDFINPPIAKVTQGPKPLFPILEVWKIFPQTKKNNFYYKIG